MIMELTLIGGIKVYVNLAEVAYWIPIDHPNESLSRAYEIWFDEEFSILVQENPADILKAMQRQAQFSPNGGQL